MRLIDSPISLDEFRSTCYSTFDRMVKIDIDIERKIIAADAEMHADLEEILLEAGSKQEDVWGANIYPEELPPEEDVKKLEKRIKNQDQKALNQQLDQNSKKIPK